MQFLEIIESTLAMEKYLKLLFVTQKYVRRWFEHSAFKTVKVKVLFWLFNSFSAYILVASEFLITVILLLKIPMLSQSDCHGCSAHSRLGRIQWDWVQCWCPFPSLHLQKVLYQFLEENVMCDTWSLCLQRVVVCLNIVLFMMGFAAFQVEK